MTSNTSIKAALTVAQGEGGYFLGWLGTPEADVVLEHMTFPGNVVKSMPITTKHPQLASTFSQTTARYALAYPGPAEDQVSVRWLDAQGIWDKTEGQVKNQFSFGDELPLFMGWAQDLSVVLGHRGIGAGCGVPAAAMFTDVATVTTAGFALGSCSAKLNGVLRVGAAASGSLAALFVGGTESSVVLLDPSASNVDPIPFAKVTLAKLVGKAGAMAWSGSAYRISYQAEDGMVSESFAPNGISMDDRAVLSPKALSPRGALFDDASQRLVVVGQDAGGALYLVSQGKDGISSPVLVGGGANSRDVHLFAEGAGYRIFWLGKSGNFEQVFSNLVSCP